MLHSALNFAAGFFGFPIEDKYQQSILIEKNGVSMHSGHFVSFPHSHYFFSSTALFLHIRRVSCVCSPSLASFDLLSSADVQTPKFKSKAARSLTYVKEWTSIYLKDAHARLASQLHGYDMTIEDTYIMQQMCAYEVSSLNEYHVRC
jgi:hypothetical protein